MGQLQRTTSLVQPNDRRIRIRHEIQGNQGSHLPTITIRGKIHTKGIERRLQLWKQELEINCSRVQPTQIHQIANHGLRTIKGLYQKRRIRSRYGTRLLLLDNNLTSSTNISFKL